MRATGSALGKALCATRGAALVVTVQGELGAGKTTLVGGLLNALGVPGPIRSPTYTLIEPYETDTVHIYHLDLYRLTDAREVEALGLRDLLDSDAALLIEWPERGAGMLPPVDLHIAIEYPESGAAGRRLALTAATPTGQRLLQQFRGVVN